MCVDVKLVVFVVVAAVTNPFFIIVIAEDVIVVVNVVSIFIATRVVVSVLWICFMVSGSVLVLTWRCI